MTLGANYRTQFVDDLSAIGRDAWTRLLAADTDVNPFLHYDFLHALHESGAASAASGWSPHYLTVWRADRLVAAAPLYAKAHSYGEYVFDWAWAEAYQKRGIAYYPKWLVAVPFTPVGGSRLIAVDDDARARLADALVAHARASGLSSLHVLLAPAAHTALLQQRGLLLRQGVQFHWRNAGYADFDEFLARMLQPKRKKIRAERRKVAEHGVELQRRPGAEISDADWKFFHRCYCATYAAHWSTPYLNLDFFLRIGRSMPERLMMVVALRNGQPIASALGVYDQTRLYGRYWGALEQVPCLHFECCYYQMIEFAIERRLQIFEGGAQGAHKIARGLDPVPTYSAHWLAHPGMHDAVRRFLAQERAGVEHAIDELNEHRAWRPAPDSCEQGQPLPPSPNLPPRGRA
ncbi:MAG: GNAT family N-acetyltransferase [Gemmatimonadota bacterium]